MSANQYRLEEEKILEVLEIYRTRKARNPATTIRGVADEFDVSEKRLWRRVHNLPSRSTRRRVNVRFDEAQYIAIFEYLDRLEAWGTPATSSMLKCFADSILRRAHTGATRPPAVSKNWVSRFLRMFPKYKKQRMDSKEAKRAAAENPRVIEDWYTQLALVIEVHGIVQEDIYSMDETGFRIGQGRNEYVIVKEKNHKLSIGNASSRTTIASSLTVVNAVAFRRSLHVEVVRSMQLPRDMGQRKALRLWQHVFLPVHCMYCLRLSL